MSGQQEQENSRRELSKSHQPQVQCSMRNRVDLPSDSHGLHFGRRRRQKPHAREVTKVGIAESRPGTIHSRLYSCGTNRIMLRFTVKTRSSVGTLHVGPA